MKKGIKLSAATVMALSAITPVAAFAAEPEASTTVKDGYYIDGAFIPAADFAAKSKKAKVAFIKENITSTIYLVLNGKVYDLTDEEIQNAEANEIESLGKDYDVFKEETGIELTENGAVFAPIPSELKVESVSAINTQEQAVALDAVTLNGAIVLKFSEAIDKETANVNNIRVFTKEGNVPVANSAANIQVSKDGKIVTVKLPANTEAATEYTLVVKNIKADASNSVVADKTIEFKTSNNAVVSSILFDETIGAGTDVTSNPSEVHSIAVDFNKNIAPSTVTNSNVYLTDVTTGQRVSVAVSVSGLTLTVTPSAPITPANAKKYELTIQNLETTTGESVEKYVKVFTVNDTIPTVSTVKTLDGTSLPSSAIYPKLAAGTHETLAGTTVTSNYYAGLKLQVQFSNRLNASSVPTNIQLFDVKAEKVVDATVTYNADARIATILPKADLKEGTDYEVQFLGGLQSEFGSYLNEAKKDEAVASSSKAFTTLDVTVPTVVEFTSTNGNTNLDNTKAQEFTVKLSEDMTLANANIVVTSAAVKYNDASTFTGPNAGNVLTAGTDYSVTKVVGTEDTYKVRILANKLAVNSTYNVTVVGKDLLESDFFASKSPTVLVDGDNNALKNSYSYSFTTIGADVTAPKLSTVYRAANDKDATKAVTSGAVTNISAESLTFAFDEVVALNGTVLAGDYVLEEKSGSRWVSTTDSEAITVNAASADVNGKNKLVKVDFTGLEDKEYRLVFKAGSLKDTVSPTANETLKDITFEFVGTVGDDTIADTTVQAGKYTATGNTIAVSATPLVAVDTKSSVLVTFNEDQIFEVAASSVKVTDKDGNEVAGTLTALDAKPGLTAGAAGTVKAYDAADKYYVFTPTAELAADATYTVTIEGVKDLVGNKIAKKVVQFTTEAAALKFASASIEDDAQAVDRQKAITVALNKAADSEVVTVKLQKADGTLVASGTTKDKKTYTISNYGELDPNTAYKLVVTIDTEDPKVINFTTGAVSTDNVAPSLVEVEGVEKINGIYTLANSTDANDGFDFTFNEAIEDGTVTIINLTSAASEDQVAVVNSVVDDTKLTANLASVLKAGQTYRVTITGVADKAGNVADTITINVKTPQ